jgi:hypothetical protein
VSAPAADIPGEAARPRTATCAIALYGLVAAAWAAMAVLRVQRGSGPSLWALLPIAAYAAGLACGTACLRPLPAPGSGGRLVADAGRAAHAFTWALRLVLAHAILGVLGTLSLATLEAGLPHLLGLVLAAIGLVVVPVAMLVTAVLSLFLPRCARGSDAFIVAAFGGAGWLALLLCLLG